MNVLFYFPDISKNNGGIYQYSVALLKILSKDISNFYYLYAAPNEELGLIVERSGNLKYVDTKYYRPGRLVRKVLLLRRIFIHCLQKLGLKLKYQNDFDWIINRYDIRLVYSPFQLLPAVDIPCIVTLHDVQELHFPHFFSSAERAFRAVKHKESIDKAVSVIVSYQHIKDDIVRFFSKPSNQIHVVLLSMENLWFEKFLTGVVPKVEADVPDKFILYPAATWVHKNHLNLLQAIYLLKQQGVMVNLVCTGFQNEHYCRIKERINELNLTEQVFFLGIVEDYVLFSLYRKTIGVVIPTLYEAGSFPLMESLILEVPVICSNVTSLPETIGDLQFVFNPHEPADIAIKIKELVTSEEFRNRSKKNSLMQSKRILETDALLKIRAVINECL